MDGFMCMLNKDCRNEKSKEIVQNMNNEENTYKAIYEDNKNK